MTKRIILVLVILFILVVRLFDTELHNEYFEDGSGIITVSYCVPFSLCD